eukprot:198527_1
MDPNAIKEAKNWFPFNQTNDILITSYPKCGHHFTQKMCLEILNANHNGKYTSELYKTSDMGFGTMPYVEFYVSQTPKDKILEGIKIRKNIYPHIWFTHHYLENIPMNNITKQHKIICMIRNPKDCIVSALSFFNKVSKDFPQYADTTKEYDLDDMISYFVRGIMIYGCYFKYYESYWKAYHKDNYNILWLYYEDCVDNPLENIKKIANFIFDGNDIDNE